MSKTSDWLPSGRQDQLSMARNWIEVITSSGTEADSPSRGEKWGMADAALRELRERESEAATALAAAKSEETRTPVATARCKTAFESLAVKMRDIKKRYFYVPPLTEADLVALGLKVPDKTSTASGVPAAEVTIETYLVGRHQLGIKIIYLTGNPSDPANKSYRVWYSVVAPGETPPGSPDELRKSFSTKRKKDVIDFDFGDSGKTVFFAVQIENEKKKGPWGPLVSALIP